MTARTGLQETDWRRRTLHVREHGSPATPTDLGPTALIIAPTSVTDNWMRELETVSVCRCAVIIKAQEPSSLSGASLKPISSAVARVFNGTC